MARILFVESDKEIRALISTAIKSEFRVHIFYSEDARSAIQSLKTEKFDLVLCREQIEQQRTGASLANFRKKKPEDCPYLLILGDEKFEVDGVENLPIPYEHDDLISKVHAQLTEAKIHLDKENVPPYIPFELVFFKNMQITPCDLFLKMIRSDGAHFVKRFRKEDNVDQEAIEKYRKGEKIKNLYVDKKDRFAFFNYMVKSSFDYICKAKSSDVHLTVDRHAENYQIIQNMVNVFGIDEETIRICDKTVKKMMDHVKQYNMLNDLLRAVLSSPGSYAYKHCYLNILMTAHILPHLKWSGEKHFQIVLEKMTYVAFFHDICLQDDKLIKISNKIQFYKSDLTPKERELVENHANMAATLLQRYPGLPSGVDLIVKQHHGTTNGIGFTDYYKANISQMAILFIILEEFVGQVLDYSSHKNGVLKILNTMSRQYELPSYLRIVDALKESVMSPSEQKKKVAAKKKKAA